MPVQQCQVGDIGTKFLITIREDDASGNPIDISGAAIKEITIARDTEAGPAVTKPASFETDGKDGKMFILSEDGDLSVDGKWLVQGRVQLDDGTWRTSVGSFPVRPNLPAGS